ncbi:MAG: hypothetical protein OEZ68_11130 [Gammaproteobacteria bacterium]|nr:hypothetical protein [Gammaproteobacteria bacterium]MDH5801345.1 hypothetical protein [Gammaproteobacteria bacterium]
MLDVLTWMVTAVSVVAVVLMGILVVQIYNEDHPLNQNRKDTD